ncbi:hypothetical protein AAFF_G00230280 [Aldrovandia affinis]|uniref:Uncharacterized protein n=1 Tax=Aldrovandia affinis TaxID=143900 RepID=A0AAD7SWX4_9TELE|nr:hypothetical protein AAFF_G00230280 [Aldrovandia affinis]
MLERYRLVVVLMSLNLVTTRIVMTFPVTPTIKRRAQEIHVRVKPLHCAHRAFTHTLPLTTNAKWTDSVKEC